MIDYNASVSLDTFQRVTEDLETLYESAIEVPPPLEISHNPEEQKSTPKPQQNISKKPP